MNVEYEQVGILIKGLNLRVSTQIYEIYVIHL